MKLLKLLIKLEGNIQLKIVEIKEKLRKALETRKVVAKERYEDSIKRIEKETKDLNDLG